MNFEKEIKLAKVLNIVEIVITLALFIWFRAVSGAIDNSGQLAGGVYVAHMSILALVVVTSIVVIVLTAILMSKTKKHVKGLGLLLASGIATLIFAISGVMIGLVIWIFSGLSLSKLNQKIAEDNFESQLSEELSAEQAEPAIEQAAEVPATDSITEE